MINWCLFCTILFEVIVTLTIILKRSNLPVIRRWTTVGLESQSSCLWMRCMKWSNCFCWMVLSGFVVLWSASFPKKAIGHPKASLTSRLIGGHFYYVSYFNYILHCIVLKVLHDIHKVKSGWIEPLQLNRLTLPLVIVCSYRPRHFRCTRS